MYTPTGTHIYVFTPTHGTTHIHMHIAKYIYEYNGVYKVTNTKIS